MKIKRTGAFIILLIFVLIAVGLYMYLREPAPPVDPGEEYEVQLYFSTPDAMYLDREKRTVSGQDFYKNVLNELIIGPTEENLSKTIPETGGVLNIEHDRDKESLIVNFNEEWQRDHWGGSAGERLTIYSVVNTMTSLPEVERVGFRVEGQQVETLAGHMDLTAEYQYSEDLVLQEEAQDVEQEEFEVEIEESD